VAFVLPLSFGWEPWPKAVALPTEFAGVPVEDEFVVELRVDWFAEADIFEVVLVYTYGSSLKWLGVSFPDSMLEQSLIDRW